ncbi:glucosyltransferase domain-containing protein [Synechococcus sp. Tobar12-5m-g]|uniref:glucosyltransferase domain-containing protein n=1 Tax=Synechococcus sp. Tobar12-5m-g TaxID=2823742 RepID=UPI0020CC4DCD|nr:glucosyltransferase domain-containing protein [Synechococcus sp. Tobar12-5m-g]MCP9772345.1 glucosyltransferase domain-containing protein [Synechococcus sp. Tobar12-5m-g]MCP9873287.1 glucosyltransferase domain-containing protein [Synechococcus sp. Cruz CV-v-12]
MDDWALLGQPIHQASQSRPGWDIVYTLLFQNSFSPFFGWLIAGLSIYGLAAVTTVFSPLITPAWVCLLALLIAAHAYLLDLFNFSFAIGLYLLPATLSVWGAVLMGYATHRHRLSWLAGVLLVALAMGIYQPTGYLGIGVLGLEALARALDLRPFPARAWLRVAVGVLTGSLLYYLISLLAMATEVENERTGFATLTIFWEKLTSIKVYREIYNTNVSLMSTAPQFIFSMIFLILLLIATVWITRRVSRRRERIRRLGLLWFAAGFLTLLPMFLYFVLRVGFPSRSFCLGNFGIASFNVMVLASVQPVRPFLSRALVGLLIVAYLVPQAAFASKVWDLAQLLERRDMALAQSIRTDVTIEARRTGLPAEPFRLFGTTERNELFPHWSSVGQSAFRTEWSIPAIFKQLFGVEVRHIAYRRSTEANVRRGLPACAAYPQPGSIVPYRRELLVCLEANPAVASGG